VLLGYLSDAQWVVMYATDSGPKSLHHPSSYTPDQAYDTGKIATEFKSSLGVIRYLGDWHSHPDGIASLSYKDRSTLKRIANFPDAQIKAPLMMICAGRNNWNLGAWSVVLRRWRSQWISLSLRRFTPH